MSFFSSLLCSSPFFSFLFFSLLSFRVFLPAFSLRLTTKSSRVHDGLDQEIEVKLPFAALSQWQNNHSGRYPVVVKLTTHPASAPLDPTKIGSLLCYLVALSS
jgi:hypothetical protein